MNGLYCYISAYEGAHKLFAVHSTVSLDLVGIQAGRKRYSIWLFLRPKLTSTFMTNTPHFVNKCHLHQYSQKSQNKKVNSIKGNTIHYPNVQVYYSAMFN